MDSAQRSTLYLVPSPLFSEATSVLAGNTVEVLNASALIIAENLKTVRRFVSAMKTGRKIESWQWEELNEHTDPLFLTELIKEIEKSGSACLISEAGMPAVADPGEPLVRLCHKAGIKVVPLPGPNSIIMALAASGLNGQRFSFHAYLPIKPIERKQAIKKLETAAVKEGSTQIFIETPYRNASLLTELLEVLQPQTKLCLTVNLTAPDEFILTLSISEWRKKKPILEKVPAIFLIGA